MNGPIVEMRHISKSFPGVKALQDVDFVLYPGTVHGLVGENGAGKSTLMKILTGTYAAYEGEIFLEGQKVHFNNERDALDRGISIVPQELHFVPELTVEENVFLGREPRKKVTGFIDKKARHERTKELLASLGLTFDLNKRMIDLSVAQRQMVEIIKAISRDAKIIVMDEPTSALTDVETRQLFSHIRRLRSEGVTIVYISHKLEEIFELCDQITVMRDSRLIGSEPVGNMTMRKTVAMMVGREMEDIYPPIGTHGDEEVLRVENFTREGVFKDISFTLHKGEILGFSGMMGAGRSEIMRAIFGIDPHTSGKVFLEGKELRIRSPHDAIREGIGMVTEDRAIYGFVGGLSVKDNVVLPNTDMYAPGGVLNQKRIRKDVEDIREKISIKVPDIDQLVRNLSGGNQQKVVLAKWLVRNMKVLIIDEPTRGIDVGAKQEIYHIIKGLAEQGMAVLVVSSEMQEVIGVSHRVIVIDGGRALGEFSHEEVSQNSIMEMIVEGGRKL